MRDSNSIIKLKNAESGNQAALKVLGIGSSMRRDSFGTETLKVILQKVGQNGGQAQLLNLFDNPLPIYSPDNDNDDHFIKEATAMVNWADAFIFATPDYHGSMAGSLKKFYGLFFGLSLLAKRLAIFVHPTKKG